MNDRMSLKQKILEKTKTIRGNELGWLIQLAESHLDSKTFQDYFKKNNLEPTHQFLNRLLADFHPNNFNSGRSDIEWVLIKKDDVVAVLDEATKQIQETNRIIPCPVCNGDGTLPSDSGSPETCWFCERKGRVAIVRLERVLAVLDGEAQP